MADTKVVERAGAPEQEQASQPVEQTTGHALRAGRRVLLRNGPGPQSIEILGPDGALEVEVVITDQGPVVRVKAGRMEIETPEDIDLTCRRFTVNASEGVTIESGDALLIKSADDTDIDAGGDFRAKGETIWLN